MISRWLHLPELSTLQALSAFAVLTMFAGQADAQSRFPFDDQSAVIFTYHHIGDDLAPSANLGKEQFESHIAELKSGNYHVLPISDIITALKTGTKLPDPSIGITFDGAHRNTISYAAPLLLKAGLPFTIFVSTDAMDSEEGDSLHWDDLQKLARNELVTIGLHPAAYQRLYDKDQAEIARQLNKALARYREEFDTEATLFAYPFGEISEIYRQTVERQGFLAAFGQQSGVAYAGADMFMLPRFSMTEPYGDIERFRLTALALPLPVKDVSPHDPYVVNGKPEIGFTIDPALKNQIKSISCFSSAPEKAELQVLGGNRVEIRLKKPFEDERGRINCTMPGPLDETTEQPRWRWYGMMLTLPMPYDEPVGQDESDSTANLGDEPESQVE